MAHDVFISYSSKDKAAADAVCAALEAGGIRCWIAPRDVLPGQPYGEALIDAINAARALILVFTANANESAHIAKEVERAVSRRIAVIPFRIENVMPARSLDYFIGSVHWLDAMTPPMEQHLQHLVRTTWMVIQGVPSAGPETGILASRKDPPAPPPAPQPVPPPRSSLGRGILLGSAVVALAALGFILFRPGASAATRALAGDWQWPTGNIVTIRKDGTFSTGTLNGTWRVVDGAERRYQLTWPPIVDQLTMTSDGRQVSGVNQYGIPVAGTRLSGSGGLAGSWRWGNGGTVTMSATGTVSAGPFTGQWQRVAGVPNGYTITWPAPVDGFVIGSDGSLAGANQYGVQTRATKKSP